MKPTLDIGQSAHLIDLGVDPKLASKCVLYFCDEYDEPLASWDRYEENGKVFCATEEAYGRSVESRIVSMDADFDQSAKEENPIFDLSDILNILPHEIEDNNGAMGGLAQHWEPSRGMWCAFYYGWAECFYAPELIHSLYQLLCWVITNGYYKPKTDNQ